MSFLVRSELRLFQIIRFRIVTVPVGVVISNAPIMFWGKVRGRGLSRVPFFYS